MIKVIFYCDIVDKDDNIEQTYFDFDEGCFDSQESLDKYMDNCGYAIGETCAYWGDSRGILQDVLIERLAP